MAKILIVEDEGLIARHIASRLEMAGYEVAGVAQSSEEALTKISELNPELILMDIHIKGKLDGIETVAAFQNRFDIPVIYLTAHTDQQTIDRAKSTIPAGFLTKPVHETTLKTSVEMAIHKHEADRSVRLQKAWMATVLDTMADAMAVIDCSRNVKFLNGAAEKLTGWTSDEARDRNIALVLPLKELGTGLVADEALCMPRALSPAAQIPAGLLAGGRSGKSFPIEGAVAPSMDRGRVVGAVITFRDGTGRQARESDRRQQEKMQAVGLLAAGIAHDFNNLLFVILGHTEEMLATTARTEPDLNALNEIRLAGESAANLTLQLLKFSRRGEVNNLDLNLNEMVAGSADSLRRLCGPGVEWQFQLAAGLSKVRGNRAQLQQVLMNLAANARDAMPAGGTITVETRQGAVPPVWRFSTATGTCVCLSFSDTGFGMNAQTAERLFEPFFTTKDSGKGTGLGLSIVHSIVDDFGGRIEVESEPGEGATFRIYFPFIAEAQGAMEVADQGLELGPADAAMTILLVEDQSGLRQLMRDYLANSGCRVLVAKDGEEAVRVADQYAGRIDLLLTDVVMPKANGFDVARALTAVRAELKIIFISGFAQDLLDAAEDLPPGARSLPKPFALRDLLTNVCDLLRNENSLVANSSA